MVKSMTGFGRCEISEGTRKITVEMKSVNHRYLDVNTCSRRSSERPAVRPAVVAHGHPEALPEEILEVVRVFVAARKGDRVDRLAGGDQQPAHLVEAAGRDGLADRGSLQLAEGN